MGAVGLERSKRGPLHALLRFARYAVGKQVASRGWADSCFGACFGGVPAGRRGTVMLGLKLQGGRERVDPLEASTYTTCTSHWLLAD